MVRMLKLFLLILQAFLWSCVPTTPMDKKKASEVFFKEKKGVTLLEGEAKAASMKAFKAYVHPIFEKSCVRCHSTRPEIEEDVSPKFAHDNVETAWIALTSSGKINFTNPASSRMIEKLRRGHRCWDDCTNNADELLAGVELWSKAHKGLGIDIGVTTSPLPFPDAKDERMARTDYGRVLLQAEQDFYGVLNGRYEFKINSEALAQQYITAKFPPPNPITSSTRTASITGAACSDEKEYEVSETGLHIKSGTRGPTRDGYVTYSYAVTGQLIRPDRRKLFAKMMYENDFSEVETVLLRDGPFVPLSSVGLIHKPGTLAPSQEDNIVSYPAFRILPHFVSRDEVFEPDSNNFKGVDSFFTKDDGSSASLYQLFADGAYEPLPSVVYKELEDEGESKEIMYKKNLVYPSLKRKVNAMYTGSKLVYNKVIKMSQEAFLATEGITIQMDCRDEWIGQENFPTRATLEEIESNGPFANDIKPYRNCDPNREKPGQFNFARWENITLDNQYTKLTYSNAMDWMSYDPNSDSIIEVASNHPDVTSSPRKAFRRIDLFQYYTVDPRSRLENTENTLSIMTRKYEVSKPQQTLDGNGYVRNEQFDIDSSETFPISVSPGTIDLDHFYVGTQGTLGRNLEVENFAATLHKFFRPDLYDNDPNTNASNCLESGSCPRCIACHSTGNELRFAQDSSSAAMQAIKDKNLIAQTSSESFRKAVSDESLMVHNCDATGFEGNAKFNCDRDNELHSALKDAIDAWKAENVKDESGDGVKNLSLKERTPGRAVYEFEVNEAGYYNVWFRMRKSGPVNSSFEYQLKDPNGNRVPVQLLNVQDQANPIIGSPADQCIVVENGFDSWTWTTDGRNIEYNSIDHKGNRVFDEEGRKVALPDQRRYFYLGDERAKQNPVFSSVPRIYTLEIFEKSLGNELDVIAFNKVKNFSPEGRLNFQPDILTKHYGHISNYKRNILKYDLSHLLKLEEGEKAYFEIEVKLGFQNQLYIFRAPRFVFKNNRNKKIHVKGIRGLINNNPNVNHNTYDRINLVVGKGRVLTHADMTTNIKNLESYNHDTFSFAFEKLAIVDNLSDAELPSSTADEDGYSQIDLLSPPNSIRVDTPCKRLDLFTNTIKPLLKYLTVALVERENKQYSDNYFQEDGLNRAPQAQRNDSIPTHRCMTCHNETHQFFKMTTFEFNDDLLCRQALSRVDFDSPSQSRIVKGINSEGKHPEFIILEEFFLTDENAPTGDIKYAEHNEADDYLKGFNKHYAAGPGGIDSNANPDVRYKSRYVHGPLAIFRAEDFGWDANTTFGSLSAEDPDDNGKRLSEQDKARMIGKHMRQQFWKIPDKFPDPDSHIAKCREETTTEPKDCIGGYDSQYHESLLGSILGEADILDPGFILGEDDDILKTPLKVDRNARGRKMYWSPYGPLKQEYFNRYPTTSQLNPDNIFGTNNIVNFVPLRVKNDKNKITSTIDYRGDIEGVQPYDEFNEDLNRVKDKVRQTFMNWINAELLERNPAYEGTTKNNSNAKNQCLVIEINDPNGDTSKCDNR